MPDDIGEREALMASLKKGFKKAVKRARKNAELKGHAGYMVSWDTPEGPLQYGYINFGILDRLEAKAARDRAAREAAQ